VPEEEEVQRWGEEEERQRVCAPAPPPVMFLSLFMPLSLLVEHK